MRDLAAFASSAEGKVFARIEQRFGRDPAASLEEIDDVLAHNLRAAFLVTLAEPEKDEEDEYQKVIEETRRAGQAIRG